MRATGPKLPFLLSAMVLLALGQACAQRLVFDEASTPRVIKACVLTPDGGSGLVAEEALLGLQRAPFRPQGWRFANPLAPTETVTGMSRPTGVPDGWPVLDTWPVYWQAGLTDAAGVNHIADTHRLVGMDFIYMPVNLNVPAGQRDGLIQAVEDGALLWIDAADVSAAASPVLATLAPPRVTPTGGAGAPPDGVAFEILDAPSIATRVGANAFNIADRVSNHENSGYFDGLFQLTATDVGLFCTSTDRLFWPHVDAGWTHDIDARFLPVILGLDAGDALVGPVALTAQYGRGTILVTTGAVGNRLASWLTNVNGPDPAETAALKFAYNAINRHLQMRQLAAAGGRAASTSTKAPVELQWQYPAANRRDKTGAQVSFGPVVAAPVQYDGRVYVITTRATGAGEDGRARLVCLDAEPERDLSGNGDADDGIPDFSTGTQYDVIWEYVFAAGLTPRASGIAMATMTDGGGEVVPVVVCAVTDESPAAGAGGQVFCFHGRDGSAMWANPFTVTPYGSDGRVCDISTPVCHNGWVYFLASEYDGTLPSEQADAEDQAVDATYGRAWCIDLQTGGELNNNSTIGGAVWVFPAAHLDRTATGVGEPQRSLPCFNDPRWVAGVGGAGGLPGDEVPPLATPEPTITSGATVNDEITPGTVRRGIVDALVICGTPVTHRYDGSLAGANGTRIRTDWTGWQNRGGGSEFCLVPTPTGGDGSNAPHPRLNREYYSVALAAPVQAWGANQPVRQGYVDVAGTFELSDPVPAAAAGRRVVSFPSVDDSDEGVRQFIARWCGEDRVDVLKAQQGMDIEIEYDSATSTGVGREAYRLPGPVRWSRQYKTALAQSNETRTGSAVAVGNTVFCPTMPPVDWTVTPPRTQDPSAAPPGDTPTALITALETEGGNLQYRLDPRVALPVALDPAAELGSRNAQALLLAGPAADDGTLIAATTLWQVGGPGSVAPGDRIPCLSAVVGLKQEADLEIHLGADPALGDHVAIVAGSVSLHLIENLDISGGPGAATLIPASSYTVDPLRRIIRIDPQKAHDVEVDELAAGGTHQWPNPISGKAVQAIWTGSDGNTYTETRLFDPGFEFTYVPGFVKLHRYPVILDSVRVYLPDDTPSLQDNVQVLFDGSSGPVTAEPGEPPVSYNCTGGGAVPTLPNGWLDMRRGFVDLNGNGSYDAGTDQEVPLGTEVIISYTGYYEPAVGWTAPAGYPAAYAPQRGFTPIPNPMLGLSAEMHQIPVEFGPSTSTPTAAGKTALVGAAPFDPQWDGSYPLPGGAMSRAETLLAVNWGNRRESMAWGRTMAPAAIDENDDGIDATQDPTEPIPMVAPVAAVSGGALVGSSTNGVRGYLSKMSTTRTLICAGSRIIECVGSEPFRTIIGYNDGGTVRPFRQIAKATSLPNGNLLVVDTGNSQVVELDEMGNVIWPRNVPTSLRLNQPTDAWRYTTTTAGGARWAHTVIADAGNRRIIEVVTKDMVTQSHEVYLVSPAAWDPEADGKAIELQYQTAQPILDPQTGHLWGYLASAANWNSPLIVEPPRFDAAGHHYAASINPPAGTAVLGAYIGNPPYTGPGAFEPAMLPPITAGAVWDRWAFIEGLEFRNIRQVEYVSYGNADFGEADNTFLWVVASDYLGLPGDPMGVWEFGIPARVGDPLVRFTRANYVLSGQATIPLPNGSTYTKTFFPTSAKRLPDGSYLLSNYAGAVENMVPANLDPVMWSKALTSEILRVDVTRAGVPYPVAVFGRHTIPDPRKPMWPEPLNLVTYVERF